MLPFSLVLCLLDLPFKREILLGPVKVARQPAKQLLNGTVRLLVLVCKEDDILNIFQANSLPWVDHPVLSLCHARDHGDSIMLKEMGFLI